MPLKLYLALIRRSSTAPFDTNLSARRWATLLDLDDPSGNGARRISDAIQLLEKMKLVRVERVSGEVPTIFLLREDGSGMEYNTPTGARSERARVEGKLGDLYLQIPDDLWRDGHIQAMSAPELVMLLILLAESPSGEPRPTWWSGTNFYRWYHIAPGMRTTGTTELMKRGMLSVTKMMIDTPRGGNGDNRDRVRNSYRLMNLPRTDGKASSTATPLKKRRGV